MDFNPGLPKGDSTIIALQGTTPWVVTGGSVLAVRIDESDPNEVYIGEAETLGQGGDQAVWRIKLMTINSGAGSTIIEWASGDADFDKVWDDRATYIYS